MGKFKIQKSATVNQYFDTNNVIGGTGGNTSITGSQIRPNVFVTGAAAATYGNIKAQKGRAKFLVTDGTYTGQCTLQNLPNANLAAGQMSIGVDTAYITYANVNAAAGSQTYGYITYLTANVTGPKAVAAGDYIRATSITGNVIVNTVTANTTTLQTNANVTFSSQSVTNASNTANLYVGGFASRLSNKVVRDFAGNKYQWTFNNPTTTTARIPGA
jgi:hypothetical protein